MTPHAVLHWLSLYAPAIIFLNLALGIVGIPALPEALLVVTGAHLLSGDRSLSAALVAAILGSAVGMSVSYQFGRSGLRWAQRRAFVMRVLQEQRIAGAAAWCRRVGPSSVVFGYFAPGARHLAAMGAGVAEINRAVFLLAAVLGASVWAGTLVWIGVAVGRPHGAAFPWYVPVLAWSLIIAAALRARRMQRAATL